MCARLLFYQTAAHTAPLSLSGHVPDSDAVVPPFTVGLLLLLLLLQQAPGSSLLIGGNTSSIWFW
ncbi:hypothetical protein JOB18_001640 [Solea senegalensis]|uniref:Uncharacterized protein n=1 Tax=Solea senegalensis TaxID=28829 RepID=A0AAV6QBM3_SOLSE|nr:hypothetical protein JOB18_001640 [Solea senegalensis]